MPQFSRFLASLMAAIAVLACGGSASTATRSTGPVPSPSPTLTEHLRTITTRYQSPSAAEADGYSRTDPSCVSSPPNARVAGGMGYHYVNRQLASQPPDLERPATLNYIPDGKGGLKLGAVEYYKASVSQNLADSSDRPFLAGQPFNGPMPGHFPGQPIHYDLHLWVWQTNPAGLFAMFNPDVVCPPAV